jgi:hypothetical protein
MKNTLVFDDSLSQVLAQSSSWPTYVVVVE